MTSAWLANQLVAAGARWARWTAVEEPMVLYAGAFVLGVGGYFALTFQPTWWQIALFVSLAVVFWWFGRRGRMLVLSAAGLWVALGVLLAHVHTVTTATPLLFDGQPTWVKLSGSIEAIDYRVDGQRLYLNDLDVINPNRLQWLEAGGLQVRPRQQRAEFAVGQRVEGQFQVFPIGPPPVPGSIDLQFRAFFQGMSAYAVSVGTVTVLDDGNVQSFNTKIAAIRQSIKNRIFEILGEERGGVLVAMTVGFPRTIQSERLEAYRAAGLAHLLAISGLHMTLVVSWVFWVLRLCFAFGQTRLLPSLWAIPIKKVAILCALAVGLSYFFVSGQAVPVQRAFTMATLFAFAIIVDRRGISLRLLCLAAILVVTVAPEVILGPSFQMSFAAVTVLIIVSSMIPRGSTAGLGMQLLRYAGAIAVTSAVATLATALLTLFHFGQVSLVSVLANVLAVPITALLVMPSALIALLLMPFGLETPFLMLAGYGLDVVQLVANIAQGLPNSTLKVANWPRSIPACLGLALVCAALMKTWRKAYALLILCAIGTLIALHRPADIVLTEDFGLATAVVSKPSIAGPNIDAFHQSFLTDYWRGEVVQMPTQAEVLEQLNQHPQIRCSKQGCLLFDAAGKPTVGLALTREAVDQACNAKIPVIAAVFVPTQCRMPAGATPAQVRENGPIAIWLTKNGKIRLQTDLDRRGRRPWVGARY